MLLTSHLSNSRVKERTSDGGSLFVFLALFYHFLRLLSTREEKLPIIVNHRFPITLPRLFMLPLRLPPIRSLSYGFSSSFLSLDATRRTEVWSCDSTYAKLNFWRASRIFHTSRDLTKNDTTVSCIMSFYKRLFLPGCNVSCTIYKDNFTRIFMFKTSRTHNGLSLNKWYRMSCQSTNRRTFYPPDRFNSHGTRVLWVISGRLEARRSRLVDQIVSTCRRCRSGFPSTRSNANSIVAGSKSYLSRIYPRPSRTGGVRGKGIAITPGANAIRSKQSIK